MNIPEFQKWITRKVDGIKESNQKAHERYDRRLDRLRRRLARHEEAVALIIERYRLEVEIPSDEVIE